MVFANIPLRMILTTEYLLHRPVEGCLPGMSIQRLEGKHPVTGRREHFITIL